MNDSNQSKKEVFFVLFLGWVFVRVRGQAEVVWRRLLWCVCAVCEVYICVWE